MITHQQADQIETKRGELMRFAFDQICPKPDWKDAIDCIVPWEHCNVYMQAIEFMTATKCEYSRANLPSHLVRLNSVGYRAGPAGP